jgi:hypothetical protein
MVVIVRISEATKQPKGHTMTSSESALSDLAARRAGTDASLSTSLRDIQGGDLGDQLVGDEHSMVRDWVVDVELFE